MKRVFSVLYLFLFFSTVAEAQTTDIPSLYFFPFQPMYRQVDQGVTDTLNGIFIRSLTEQAKVKLVLDKQAQQQIVEIKEEEKYQNEEFPDQTHQETSVEKTLPAVKDNNDLKEESAQIVAPQLLDFEQTISEARTKMRHKKFDQAISIFEHAIEKIPQVAAFLDGSHLIESVLLDISQSLFFRAREADMDLYLEYFASFTHGKSQLIRQYSPAIQERALYLLKEKHNRLRGRILVNANVPGASIRLNGKNVGNVPLQLNQLYSGKHLISVLKDGFEPYTTEVIINEKQHDIQVQAVLGGAGKGNRAVVAASLWENTFPAQAIAHLSELSQEYQSNFAITGGIAKSKLGYEIFPVFINVNDKNVFALEKRIIDTDMLSADSEAYRLAVQVEQSFSTHSKNTKKDIKLLYADIQGSKNTVSELTIALKDIPTDFIEAEKRSEDEKASKENSKTRKVVAPLQHLKIKDEQ